MFFSISTTQYSNIAVPGRKRTRVSYSNSEELAQMAVPSNPPDNPPVKNMPTSNESSEMPREIRQILEERCPSAEFQEFLENFHGNLERKYRLLHNKNILISSFTHLKHESCSMTIKFCRVREIVI